jgi:hypothetical protein
VQNLRPNKKLDSNKPGAEARGRKERLENLKVLTQKILFLFLVLIFLCGFAPWRLCVEDLKRFMIELFVLPIINPVTEDVL